MDVFCYLKCLQNRVQERILQSASIIANYLRGLEQHTYLLHKLTYNEIKQTVSVCNAYMQQPINEKTSDLNCWNTHVWASQHIKRCKTMKLNLLQNGVE